MIRERQVVLFRLTVEVDAVQGGEKRPTYRFDNTWNSVKSVGLTTKGLPDLLFV
jgi:hypothetical protein